MNGCRSTDVNVIHLINISFNKKNPEEFKFIFTGQTADSIELTHESRNLKSMGDFLFLMINNFIKLQIIFIIYY